MAAADIGKWNAGAFYGPVLSTTELYMLKPELLINPIFTGTNPGFHLVCCITTGQTGGFNEEARDRDLPFTPRDEPATLPRVKELILISEHSPWCTFVKNDHGVTLGNVCETIWKDYTEHNVTEAEFTALPPRLQEQIKRHAQHNAASQASGGPWTAFGFHGGTPAPGRYKRVDWLREKVYFEGLKRDDNYAIARLGFAAPNIFIMNLSS